MDAQHERGGFSGVIAQVLAWPVTADTVDDFLQELAGLSTQLAEDPVSCGVTVYREGRPATVAATDESASQLDECQYRTAAGPCLQALDSAVPVMLTDLEAEQRWPEFLEVARNAGLQSSLSLPLLVDQEPVAGINLYSFTERAMFTGQAQNRYELFAAVAAGRLRQAVGHGRGQEVADLLHEELASRMVIDMATGIVMCQLRCSAEDAAYTLWARSQVSQVPFHKVASDVVARVRDQSPPWSPPFDDI